MTDLRLPQEITTALETAKDPSKLLVRVSQAANSQGPNGMDVSCSNCNDARYIYLIKLQQRVQTPSNTRTRYTWVDEGPAGTGWYEYRSEAYPCPACQRVTALQLRFQQSGLEIEERKLSVADDYLPMVGKEEARKAALQVLSMTPHPHGWVTFWGDYGRGKSHALKCLVASFVRAGVAAKYILAADMLGSLTATFDRPDPDKGVEELLSEYNRYKVLALDEVHAIPTGGWHMATLHRFLDRRYRQGVIDKQHLTLLAINRNPRRHKDAAEAVWGYLNSRMSGGLVVEVTGDDLRPLEGQATAQALGGSDD